MDSDHLLVEVWSRGLLWDRAIGYALIALKTITYSQKETAGRWYAIDLKVDLVDGNVAGTHGFTGHSLLLDCRFEIAQGNEWSI